MDGRRATESPADEAIFVPAPLVGRRRPPLLAAGAALIVGGLVAIGLVTGSSGDAVKPALEPGGGPRAAVGASPTNPLLTLRTRPPRSAGPVPTIDPRLVRLELHPEGHDLFVHGDVFALDVIVVVVSLEDAQGRLDTRSARIATGSTAFRIGANARFDVHFDVPDAALDDGLWVRANAYDTHGNTIETVRHPVWTTAAER